MEPEGSLPQSQVPVTCPYTEPPQSSPYPHIPLRHRIPKLQIKIGLLMTQRRVETCRLLHLSEIYSSILLCWTVPYLPIRLYTQRDGSTQKINTSALV
jgi:hypothetical protein